VSAGADVAARVLTDSGAGAELEQRAWTRRLQLLLGAQSLLLILASVNRIWSATDAEVLPHGSLRAVDVVNLLVLAPVSALVLTCCSSTCSATGLAERA
jgi:hypothetical protein